MTLLEKARQEAKKDGRKLDPGVVKGLKAVQEMHDILKESKGSLYQTYMDTRKK